eukprot:6969-Heterococcus_DN1.PRE.2
MLIPALISTAPTAAFPVAAACANGVAFMLSLCRVLLTASTVAPRASRALHSFTPTVSSAQCTAAVRHSCDALTAPLSSSAVAAARCPSLQATCRASRAWPLAL